VFDVSSHIYYAHQIRSLGGLCAGFVGEMLSSHGYALCIVDPEEPDGPEEHKVLLLFFFLSRATLLLSPVLEILLTSLPYCSCYPTRASNLQVARRSFHFNFSNANSSRKLLTPLWTTTTSTWRLSRVSYNFGTSRTSVGIKVVSILPLLRLHQMSGMGPSACSSTRGTSSFTTYTEISGYAHLYAIRWEMCRMGEWEWFTLAGSQPINSPAAELP
jgi:hypothetical protein